MSVNKVILVGNLGRDPEVRYLDNGVCVASFSLATSDVYTNKSGERVTQTEWHNIVLWNKLGQIAESYLTKGKQVYIEGKLRSRSYEDKEGVTRYRTEIYGDVLQMLGRKNEDNSSIASPPQGQPSQQAPVNDPVSSPTRVGESSPSIVQSVPSTPSVQSNPVLPEEDDDDLPF